MAHALPLAAIDFTLVLVAFITAVPATIAAVASILNRRALKTPSGTALGKQVESSHHTAIANNYRLQALSGELGVSMPREAAKEEAQVEALNDKTISP